MVVVVGHTPEATRAQRGTSPAQAEPMRARPAPARPTPAQPTPVQPTPVRPIPAAVGSAAARAAPLARRWAAPARAVFPEAEPRITAAAAQAARPWLGRPAPAVPVQPA